jgi:hypothetical protein
MKVRDAIELLSTYKPDDEICIAWWTRELFEDPDGEDPSVEAWSHAVAEFDREEGYEHMNRQMWVLIHGALMDAWSDGQNEEGQSG